MIQVISEREYEALNRCYHFLRGDDYPNTGILGAHSVVNATEEAKIAGIPAAPDAEIGIKGIRDLYLGLWDKFRTVEKVLFAVRDREHELVRKLVAEELAAK